MRTLEFKRRCDEATTLNACRAGDVEYLIVCPIRGDFRYFGRSPRDAIAALDRHTDDGRMYEGVTVLW